MIIRVGILTVSDRSARGKRTDTSGPLLRQMVEQQGWAVEREGIVPDELLSIQTMLIGWADDARLDLILTTGGTGFAPRDITPEATLGVIERQAPGLAEAMRAAGAQKNAHAMLSRAVCGIRGHTLIVNLPGSPQGARESPGVILPALPHAIALLQDQPEAERTHWLATV